jgi:hypothetical protein
MVLKTAAQTVAVSLKKITLRRFFSRCHNWSVVKWQFYCSERDRRGFWSIFVLPIIRYAIIDWKCWIIISVTYVCKIWILILFFFYTNDHALYLIIQETSGIQNERIFFLSLGPMLNYLEMLNLTNNYKDE